MGPQPKILILYSSPILIVFLYIRSEIFCLCESNIFDLAFMVYEK
jgi:hypothetical protein